MGPPRPDGSERSPVRGAKCLQSGPRPAIQTFPEAEPTPDGRLGRTSAGPEAYPSFPSIRAMPLDRARIQALVFDIDGTLADTDDHLVAQIASVLDAVPFVSGRRAAQWARQIVMGAETPVNAAYAAIDRAGLDDELATIKTLLQRATSPSDAHRPEAAGHDPHDMVPDVAEMLRTLADRYPISAMSTGGEDRIRAFLEHHDVLHLFQAVAGAQTTPRMKPFPDPLLYCAEAMSVAPEACLVIGDTTVDMETARAGGAQAVGVLCGFGTEDELTREGAVLTLATTSDLLGVLAPTADTLDGESADPEAAGRVSSPR